MISTNGQTASRTRRSGDEVRHLVLEAARQLFAEQGFHRTSTREIARRARVSERLIYFHFQSKLGLFEQAVVEPFSEFMGDFMEDWRRYSTRPHSIEYVARRWLQGMYDLLRQNRQLVMALLTATAYEDGVTDTLSGNDSPMAAIHQLAEEILVAEAERNGYTGIDFSLTVRLSFAMVLATAVFDGPVLAGVSRRPGRDRIIDELTALTVYGTTGRTMPG